MAPKKVECGFTDVAGGARGSQLLVYQGPTLLVNIGFDPTWKQGQGVEPVAGIQNVQALVDTGASECCIDSMLATQLNLPILDVREISGAGGKVKVNIHLAQVHIPGLPFTMHGAFAGVHLAAGGQVHQALIGRTFLRYFKLSYDGTTGAVVITE